MKTIKAVLTAKEKARHILVRNEYWSEELSQIVVSDNHLYWGDMTDQEKELFKILSSIQKLLGIED